MIIKSVVALGITEAVARGEEDLERRNETSRAALEDETDSRPFFGFTKDDLEQKPEGNDTHPFEES